MTEDQFEKLAQLIQNSHEDLSGEIQALENEMEKRFAGVDARFDKMDNEFAYLRGELRDIRMRLDALEKKVDAHSGYKVGDNWIYNSRKLFEDRAWECVFDEQEAVFGEEVDATSCAIYAGWYAGAITGPFAAPDFRFRKGAIAYHIHSWSAATLRSATSNWAGPLVAHGAAATMGCVYEPYLDMTPNVDVFFQRLLEGGSLGEAAWSSQPFLSWMNTVVGDPLYRPFAVPNERRIEVFESRFDHLRVEEKASLAWAYRFKTRQMFLAGHQTEAVQLAYQQAVRLRERALWVGLANLYLLQGDATRAAEAAKTAVTVSAEKETRMGTLLFAARTCAQARQWDPCLDFFRTLLAEFPRLPGRTAVCQEARRLAILAGRGNDAAFFLNLIPEPPSTPKP